MAASPTDKVFDELGKMTVLELVDLKKKIEDEWGITAAAPVAVAAPGGAGAGDGAEAEEKSASASSRRPGKAAARRPFPSFGGSCGQSAGFAPPMRPLEDNPPRRHHEM